MKRITALFLALVLCVGISVSSLTGPRIQASAADPWQVVIDMLAAVGIAISGPEAATVCLLAAAFGVTFDDSNAANNFVYSYETWVKNVESGQTFHDFCIHHAIAGVTLSTGVFVSQLGVASVKQFVDGYNSGSVGTLTVPVASGTLTGTGGDLTINTNMVINSGTHYTFYFNLTETQLPSSSSQYGVYATVMFGSHVAGQIVTALGSKISYFDNLGTHTVDYQQGQTLILKENMVYDSTNGSVGYYKDDWTTAVASAHSGGLVGLSNQTLSVLGQVNYHVSQSYGMAITTGFVMDAADVYSGGARSEDPSLGLNTGVDVTYPTSAAIPQNDVINSDRTHTNTKAKSDGVTITDASSAGAVGVQEGNPSLDLSQPSDDTINLQPLAQAMSDRFPFCVPYDLISSIQGLAAEPAAPKWTVTFPSNIFIGGGSFSIDLTSFNSLAAVFRWFCYAAFLVFLILVTRGIIKG
jgi:hypothetical protein